MTVYWMDAAVADIGEIKRYIQQSLRNPAAADRIANLLFDAAGPLEDNPYLGVSLGEKFDIETNLRFLVEEKYLLFYRIVGEDIEVVRVLDGRRDYLALLF